MNDNLENRLRDALDAAAGTVPDHATGPGLAATRRPHRVRRIAVAACAAAAVIAAIAAPLTIMHNRNSGQPPVLGGCPSPAGKAAALANQPGRASAEQEVRWSNSLLAGGAPKVPFTVTDRQGRGYLQDGTARVPLAAGQQVQVIGRIRCGWLVVRTDAKRCAAEVGDDAGAVGVLLPDGKFRELGRLAGSGQGLCAGSPNQPDGAPTGTVALSSDRSMVAFVTPRSLVRLQKSRLQVLSTDTGELVERRDVDSIAKVLTWNDHGIWYFNRTTTDIYRWQPGSEPRAVQAVDGTAGLDGLTGYPGNERMVREDINKRPNQACAQVIELSGDGFRNVMEHCNGGFGAGHLSPDGRLLTTLEHTYRVPGKETAFRPLSHGIWPPIGVWEDTRRTFVQSVTKGTDGQNFGRQVLVRCDAVTAACERVSDLDGGLRLRLGQP